MTQSQFLASEYLKGKGITPEQWEVDELAQRFEEYGKQRWAAASSEQLSEVKAYLLDTGVPGRIIRSIQFCPKTNFKP